MHDPSPSSRTKTVQWLLYYQILHLPKLTHSEKLRSVMTKTQMRLSTPWTISFNAWDEANTCNMKCNNTDTPSKTVLSVHLITYCYISPRTTATVWNEKNHHNIDAVRMTCFTAAKESSMTQSHQAKPSIVNTL